jgi:hypothetical protein
MFFVQRDSGKLRLVGDTYAHSVLPVRSGFHEARDNSDRSTSWLGNRINDILLTRGQGVISQEMVLAIEKARVLAMALQAIMQ